MISRCVIGAPKAVRDFIATVDVQGEDSMTATKKRAKKVKTSKRTGRVTRNKVTKADVEAEVMPVGKINADLQTMLDEARSEVEAVGVGPFGYVASALSTGTTALTEGVKVALSTILDALEATGRAVWTFLGKVFDSALAFVVNVCTWIDDVLRGAFGKTRQALLAVRERISSMNIDEVLPGVVKFMVAAAAVGVGVTAGVAVAVVTGGIAASGLVNLAGVGLVNAAWYGKVVGVIAGALSAGVVTDVVYTMQMAGIEGRVLAHALNDARKNADEIRIVPAMA